MFDVGEVDGPDPPPFRAPVQVAGGADVVQQTLDAGLLEELQIHLAPVLLGAGVRLLDRVDPSRVLLEPTRVVDSPTVTHLRYRVTG
jgi:dihydrofolate reductase